MNKTIVFIRHGHRDTDDRRLDNGLTEKGLRQAKRLSQFYSARFQKMSFEATEVSLLSSPKKRCIETVRPIESLSKAKLDLRDDLLEARAGETFEQLSDRVSHFLDSWKSEGPALTIVCSHGDWLPIAVHNLLGSVVYFKKGSWLELDWVEDQAHLRWYIPTFKHFSS